MFGFSEEAENLARRLKLRFYRTSVKENINVDDGKFKFPNSLSIHI